MKISNTAPAQDSLLAADMDYLRVLEGLYDVFDPELGINIVDLGLVYELEIQDGHARIVMTMTTPACPLHDYLTGAVEAAVRSRLPAVRVVDVRLVWDPPWDPARMSDSAKEYLGW